MAKRKHKVSFSGGKDSSAMLVNIIKERTESLLSKGKIPVAYTVNNELYSQLKESQEKTDFIELSNNLTVKIKSSDKLTKGQIICEYVFLSDYMFGEKPEKSTKIQKTQIAYA